MVTRRIGTLNVSVVGLGCNDFGRRVDVSGTCRIIDAAIDAGITFFDTADVYSDGQSEDLLGQALGGRRDHVVLATKFGWTRGVGGGRPEQLKRALEGSLRRLRVDHVDLFQIHRPDPDIPIAETLGALGDCVRAGEVREIGCCQFGADQILEAEAAVVAGSPRFASVQNEYSLLHREPEYEVLPACEDLGLAFIPYYPLKSGLLTGKYRLGRPTPKGTRISTSDRWVDLVSDSSLQRVERLIEFSRDRGHDILQLAFGYLLARPAVASVIAGAISVKQVKRNAAAGGWTLTTADVAALEPMLR